MKMNYGCDLLGIVDINYRIIVDLTEILCFESMRFGKNACPIGKTFGQPILTDLSWDQSPHNIGHWFRIKNDKHGL